jgi:hypothetical protein
MYGNPKVSTSNETTMTVSTGGIKILYPLIINLITLMKIKK